VASKSGDYFPNDIEKRKLARKIDVIRIAQCNSPKVWVIVPTILLDIHFEIL